MTELPGLSDVEAEQIVLGSMMLSASIAEQITEALTPGDFATVKHATVFQAVAAQLAAGEPTDPKAVAYRLAETDDLKSVGADYLHTLYSAPPAAANGPFYAVKVAELAARRRIVETCTRATQRAGNLGTDVAEVINAVQQDVHAATVRKSSNVLSFTQILDDTLDVALNPRDDVRGLSTRLGELDDLIGGLKPGQLVTVAGRPGAGKTVLGIDLVRAAAVQQFEPALMISLEMSAREVQQRMLAAEAEVNLARLTNGGLRPEEKTRLAAAAERLRGVPIHIDDTASQDLTSIRSTARRIQQQTGLGLLVVDYLQLMTTSVKSENRAAEVGAMSRGLKILARELGIPIVECAQLNRQSEMRSDRRPQVSDLRESGSIEQDSDIVILLHRPDQTEPEHPRAGEIDLIVGKNRNGPIDTVTAAAQLHYARIVDYGIPEQS